MVYPVSVSVEPRLADRNRLSTFLRPILSIPHALLVGPAMVARRFSATGFLGGAASVLAVVSWFLILLRDEQPQGIREFQRYYLRWHTRAVAYMALFVDEYPPFGDGPYPAAIEIADPTLPRDKATVAVRLLLAIPHFILLFFLMIAWCIATIVAWVVILFSGRYPEALYPFCLGVMRWMLRVEAYMLLLVDEYPPFSLD